MRPRVWVLGSVLIGAAALAILRLRPGAPWPDPEGAFYFAVIMGSCGWSNFFMLIIFPPPKDQPRDDHRG